MNTRTAAVASLLALTAALAACSSDSDDAKTDPAACKTAMEQAYVSATKAGAEASKPAECDGIDSKTLRQYAAEIEGKHAMDDLNDSLSDLQNSVDTFVSSIPTTNP